MEMKKTIIISAFLHVCFCSAALLLSAGIIKGGRSITDESIFFVRLAENEEQTGHGTSVTKKEAPEHIKFPKIKAWQDISFNARKQPVPVKARTVTESKDSVAEEKESLIVESGNYEPENKESSSKEVTGISKKSKNENKLKAVYSSKLLPDYSDAEESVISASYNPSAYEGDGLPEGEETEGLSPEIIRLIGNAIKKAKTYPALARRRGIEGTVYVSFRIGPEGEPSDITILKSSGFTILDAATVDVVKKAAPFPYIENRIEVPVAYKLKKFR
jgi:TonB family protein